MSTYKFPECVVDQTSIELILEDLGEFIKPYLPFFGRVENYGHARMYLTGRLQRLDRRTLEPIATEHGVHRRPLQYFVGAGLWKDGPVLDKLNEQVASQLGREDGVFIMDASGFQKWGNKSVGVQRQWCGRLGKRENCQVGEFLGYATDKGHTLVDFRLYLPQSWAEDWSRRDEAHVPKDVTFRKGWELAYEMVKARSATLPHRWVLGDDFYGRVAALRNRLAADQERYLLEVPSNTQVRLKKGDRKTYSVSSIKQGIENGKWEMVRTRDGEKGPVEVRASKMRVTTGKGDNSRRETLLIVQRSNETWYYLSNARGVSTSKMTKAAACRHYVEQSFGHGKGEVGLGEYEVRSWVGWHHHMTLSLLAMLFLASEKMQLKKNAGAHRPSDKIRHSASV